MVLCLVHYPSYKSIQHFPQPPLQLQLILKIQHFLKVPCHLILPTPFHYSPDVIHLYSFSENDIERMEILKEGIYLILILRPFCPWYTPTQIKVVSTVIVPIHQYYQIVPYHLQKDYCLQKEVKFWIGLHYRIYLPFHRLIPMATLIILFQICHLMPPFMNNSCLPHQKLISSLLSTDSPISSLKSLYHILKMT